MITPINAFRSLRGRPPLRAVVTVLAGLALAAPLALSVPGCEKVPLMAPTDSEIRLNVAATVLPINGTTEIVATVIEAGGTAVQNGTSVVFSTTLGRLEPVEAITQNGRATAKLIAGTQSGTARITATSGSAVADEVEVLIGAAAVANVVLSALPSTVPASGGTVQIVATVFDESGNPLNGVPVSFSADRGALSAASVITGSNGEAVTTLTTNQETIVTATAGATDATVTIAASAAPTVTITPPSTPPTVGQPATFTVNVTAGDAGIQSVTIDWGDGQTNSFGSLGENASITHIYRASGSFTVTVTARDAAGQQTSSSTVVFVAEATPLQLRLDADPASAGSRLYNFSVTVSNGTTGAAIQRVEWDFGDGARNTTTSTATSHAYASAGHRVVRVTVVTTDGRSGTAQTEIIVP